MTDGLKPVPDIPSVLRDAAQRGVMIPFVGAGVSVLAGSPTWGQLADGALLECVQNNKLTYSQLAQIQHLTPRVKLSIVRGLELEHEFAIDFSSLVQPKLNEEKKAIGNRIYSLLGKLGTTFVTTNYDNWLGTEIVDAPLRVNRPDIQQTTTAGSPSVRRQIFDVNEFTPANLDNPNTVFHLHGSLAEPSGMIMTTREYITRYRNDRSNNSPERENRTLTFLDYLFSQKTVLFVGYGLEDLEILEYVVQKARVPIGGRQAEAKHFMIQGYFSHEEELMRSLAQYYRQCGIQLLPFLRDRKDWALLVDVLVEFVRVMPATSPMNLEIQAGMEALLDD